MKSSILASIFARKTLLYPRLLNMQIGLMAGLVVLSTIMMITNSFHGSLILSTLIFLFILGIILVHRLYPTRGAWIVITLVTIPMLFIFVFSLPLLIETSEFITNIIIILFLFAIIISFTVSDFYDYLKSKKHRYIIFFTISFYITVISLIIGIDRVANDHEIGVQYIDFFKHRLTFKVHYQNPAWKGLELIPHTNLKQEEQSQHLKYCEIRFGVSNIAECDKKFVKQLR